MSASYPASLFIKGKMGIDGNCPIDTSSGALAPAMANPAIIADTGAAFVRLNFVLGPWISPQDTTPHAGRTWFQTYDTIIDGFLARGVQVYGLIGSEASRQADPGDRFRTAVSNADAENWLQAYATNFKAIVARYRDRVKVFESFNEPNDWHGSNCAWVHPYWFARMLILLYKRVKIETGYKFTLVSGPLLSHDLPGGGDDGTYYLDQTYRLGRAHHGWEQFQADHGTYPLDDVGYHLYVAQGPESTPADAEAVCDRYVSAIRNVITRYEGELTEKRLHVSEYGWVSDNGEDQQAAKIQAAYRTLRDNILVETASLFCLADFPGKNYGLYRQGTFSPAGRKQAYAAFCNLMAESGPAAQVGLDAEGRLYPAIISAYERNGGEPVLGHPFDGTKGDAVHRWGKGVVQSYQAPDGTMSMIMLKDGDTSAYLIRGVIRHRYIYTYGGALGPLGYPKADQDVDEYGLPRCTFEKGEIGCRTYAEFYD